MMASPLLDVMIRYSKLWLGPSELRAAADVIDEQFVRHGTSGRLHGIPAFVRYVEHYFDAFEAGVFATIGWMVAGDKATVHYEFSGRHRAPFLGIPPSHRDIRVPGVAIYRIAEGRVAEIWDFLDLASLLSAHLPFALEAAVNPTNTFNTCHTTAREEARES